MLIKEEALRYSQISKKYNYLSIRGLNSHAVLSRNTLKDHYFSRAANLISEYGPSLTAKTRFICINMAI